jgi:thiamine-phosphate pyrophosphorylase
MIQYRHKGGPPDTRRHIATDLAGICRARAIPFIVNDDAALARDVGAAGVHIGKDDGAYAEARALLGPDAIVGVSCYNSLDAAFIAAAAGASYVAFGCFFPSPTKPKAQPSDLALLRAARRDLHVPIVAIGGITPDNGAALIAAGADLLAVIHGVFGQRDPEFAARCYGALFINTRET